MPLLLAYPTILVIWPLLAFFWSSAPHVPKSTLAVLNLQKPPKSPQLTE
jgi:hypothetical protein